MRCSFVLSLILVLSATLAHAQAVSVQFFPCDPDKPIDVASPALRALMLDYGIVPDADPEAPVIPAVLKVIREKAPTVVAFAVRITNGTAAQIALKPENLCLFEGTWKEKDASADFSKAKPLAASEVSHWAGARSVFAKGETLAAKASVAGVVYFELAEEATPAPPRRVAYVPGKGSSVKTEEPVQLAGLLDELGLEWVATASAGAPAPPSGKPRILPAAGNTDDNTPLVLPPPPAINWKTTVIVAHKNIVGEQTQQAAGGMMGGGMMGGGMMGGGMMGGGMMGGGMMGGGMMGGGMMGGGMMGPGMMGGGMMGGQGPMGPGMMGGGGMMGPGMMGGQGGGMMGPGMMGGQGGGMMGPGMMGGQGGGMMGGQPQGGNLPGMGGNRPQGQGQGGAAGPGNRPQGGGGGGGGQRPRRPGS